MCYQCWLERGAPKIDTPAVREAANAIAAVYAFSGVGGALHVIVDDYNEDFDPNDPFWAEQIALVSESLEESAAYRRCLQELGALNEPERLSAIGLHWGDWTLPEAKAK